MSTELLSLNLLEVPVETFFNQDTSVMELKAKIEQAVFEASDVTVMTSTSVETAAHFIKNFSALEKKLESIRKEVKDPLLQKGKEIDAYFKKLIQSFADEKSRLEKEIMDWKRKQDQIAREKAEAERKKADEQAIADGIKKEKQLQTEAILRGEDPSKVKVEIPIVCEVIEEPVKLSQKNSSGLTTARRKTFEVVDINLIPREYLMVNEAAIKAERMKYDFEAKSTIPGVNFSFREDLR